MAGYNDLAIETYKDFGKLLAQSKDEEIAGHGLLLEGAARRLALVGKKFLLEGTTVEGEKFHWDRYKGKVVLVDFWATWCGPCRAELANIEKNYEAYHRRGFDVVGVSVDRDRKALDKFLEEHKHPWTVLHDYRDGADAGKSMSTYYGVFGIPTVILVGGDGKVISVERPRREAWQGVAEALGPAGGEKGKDGEREAGLVDHAEIDRGLVEAIPQDAMDLGVDGIGHLVHGAVAHGHAEGGGMGAAEGSPVVCTPAGSRVHFIPQRAVLAGHRSKHTE